MEKLTKEWEELKSFLPNGWEEKAKESKAICRTRKVGSAEELLRVELLHFGEGLSLYYFLIKSFNYPVSPRDAGNDLVGQRTNGIAQSLNHLFQSSKYLIMESSIPEFFPNLFNRIHFRRIWWDIKKDDIVGQI